MCGIQKGILIRERVLVELGKAKTEVHSKDIIAKSLTIFLSGRLLPRPVVKSLGGGGEGRQTGKPDQTEKIGVRDVPGI